MHQANLCSGWMLHKPTALLAASCNVVWVRMRERAGAFARESATPRGWTAKLQRWQTGTMQADAVPKSAPEKAMTFGF